MPLVSRLSLGLLLVLAIAAPHASAGPVYQRVMKAGVMRVGLPYNFIPQGFLKQSGEWTGFEVDLAEELARHMNVKLEKVKANDKTWSPMLSGGEIDAALCRIRHARYLEAEFDFSIPYFFDAQAVLASRGSVKTAQDLKGKQLAALQGAPAERTAIKLLRSAGDENAEKNVISFPDRPSCFLALAKDKAAAWVDSATILIEYASKSPGRFEMPTVFEEIEPIAVALPQDDSAWRDLVNFSLQDMYRDGSFKRVYEKWFGPETPYHFPLKRPIELWPDR